MMNPNRLPEDTNVENPSLYFNKLLAISNRNNDPRDITTNLLSISNVCGKYNKDLLNSLIHRRKKVTKSFEKLGCKVINKNFSLDNSKLLIGSGNPSIFEVGFTFSRNYGIPIIPGTTIKGVLSHYIQEELEDNHPLNENFKKLFGTDQNDNNHEKGLLIFLDAIPVRYKIGIDIVNNHFQPYYMKEDKPPNDRYNPNPVTYLVVEDARFLFTVLSDKPIKDELKNSFKEVFVECLQDFGVGAKTSYGYGLFNESRE